MLIKNFQQLAVTDLRKKALEILEEGYKAINTEKVIRNSVKLDGNVLKIKDESFDLNDFENVYYIGIGKCAFDSAKAIEEILGDRISAGIALDVKGGELKIIQSRAGTHPYPSHTNMLATAEIIAFLKNVSERDLIIAVISGGGSALLCWPSDLKCDQIIKLTEVMLKSGATIEEINTVRKHTSDIQGGWFAEIAWPTTIASLIFSDVPTGDLSMVASGPTFLDETKEEDAAEILARYNILKICELPYCNLSETPKDKKYFEKVSNILVCDNKIAAKAMMEKARKLGFEAKIHSTNFQGEVKEVVPPLLREINSKEALIVAGETTVTVTNSGGSGGRNTEAALAALPHIEKETVFAAVASDGIDRSEAAGAIADENSYPRAMAKKLDPEKFLKRNDSLNFFQETGDLIYTGITGSNVSDFIVILKT